MSYDAGIPNAGQSPGLFPAQANTNWARLKTIINADHVFNDTAPVPSTDGFHKQVTMLVRGAPSPPISPADAILYSKLDANSLPQLWYYNGTTDLQMTPFGQTSPISIVGSQVLANNATTVVFADPGYEWTGTLTGFYSGSLNNFNYSLAFRSGSNLISAITTENPFLATTPLFQFSTNDLIIKNRAGVSKTCVWSLVINRLP